jgi:glycosyltransferase involved in cell wall biosynthesis
MIDDMSTDNTIEIIQELIKDDDRFVLIKNEEGIFEEHSIPVNEFNAYLAEKEADVEKVEASKKPVSNVIKRASLFDFDSGDGDGMDNLEF